MTDESKNLPELAAGLVPADYAAEHPMPTLRKIAVQVDRPARDIVAALDRVIGSDKPFPHYRRTPHEAAMKFCANIGELDTRNPKLQTAVVECLQEWFAQFEKGGLSLCRALGLVDDGELEDYVADKGWRPPS